MLNKLLKSLVNSTNASFFSLVFTLVWKSLSGEDFEEIWNPNYSNQCQCMQVLVSSGACTSELTLTKWKHFLAYLYNTNWIRSRDEHWSRKLQCEKSTWFNTFFLIVAALKMKNVRQQQRYTRYWKLCVGFISYHSLLHGLAAAILMIYTLRKLLAMWMIRRCKDISRHVQEILSRKVSMLLAKQLTRCMNTQSLMFLCLI